MIPLAAAILITLFAATVAFLAGWQVSRSRTFRRELEAWGRGWDAGYALRTNKDEPPSHDRP